MIMLVFVFPSFGEPGGTILCVGPTGSVIGEIPILGETVITPGQTGFVTVTLTIEPAVVGCAFAKQPAVLAVVSSVGTLPTPLPTNIALFPIGSTDEVTCVSLG